MFFCRFVDKWNCDKLTFKNGRNFEHTESTDCQHLTESEFHEEHWNAGENEGAEVWNEKSAA